MFLDLADPGPLLLARIQIISSTGEKKEEKP
jgi:hypothetical protein